MKSLWTIISTLALANLLAMGGFVGWLHSSGRINRERVEAARAIFVPTLEAEAAAKVDAEKLKQEEAVKVAEEERMARPPIPAAERIKQQQDDAETKLQSKQRLDNDVKSLQAFLVRENDRLQKWEKELTERQASFEAEQQRLRETQGSEQFKKALATLSGVKPKEAQAILAELIAQNKHEEVVSYLDALEERARSKVLAEFNKADPRMAADLLERLRTRGVVVATPLGTGEDSP